MAKSDIILDDDRIRLKAADVDVDFDRQFALSGRDIKIHSLRGLQVEDPSSKDSDPKAHLNKTSLKITSNGNTARLTSNLLNINSVLAKSIVAPEITGKEIKLGNERDAESMGANGKISLTDDVGKSAIVLEMVKQQASVPSRDYINSPLGDVPLTVGDLKIPNNIRDVIAKPGIKNPNRLPDVTPQVPGISNDKNKESTEQVVAVKPELRISWGDDVAKMTSRKLDINQINSQSITTSKITISGYDLFSKIKELEEKVRSLEAKIN